MTLDLFQGGTVLHWTYGIPAPDVAEPYRETREYRINGPEERAAIIGELKGRGWAASEAVRSRLKPFVLEAAGVRHRSNRHTSISISDFAVVGLDVFAVALFDHPQSVIVWNGDTAMQIELAGIT